MFDTKQSRARVLAFGFLGLVTVGTFVEYFGDRSMDQQREDVVAAAEDRLGGIDADKAADLVVEQSTDTWEGRRSELDELLVIDGHEPTVVAYLRDGFEARYRLEVWGRSEIVVVRVDADGLDIVTE